MVVASGWRPQPPPWGDRPGDVAEGWADRLGAPPPAWPPPEGTAAGGREAPKGLGGWQIALGARPEKGGGRGSGSGAPPGRCRGGRPQGPAQPELTGAARGQGPGAASWRDGLQRVGLRDAPV